MPVLPPLIFSLKTASQSYSGQIVIGRVAALSTVRIIGCLVLSHEVIGGRTAGAERSICRFTWVGIQTDWLWSSKRKIGMPVVNVWFKRSPGRNRTSADWERSVRWTPWLEWHLMNWRENTGKWLGHRRQNGVTVVWPHFGTREGKGWFILNFMLSPSRAAVLEPDLKITTVKEGSITTMCQSHRIVDHMSRAFPSTSLSLIERVFSLFDNRTQSKKI